MKSNWAVWVLVVVGMMVVGCQGTKPVGKYQVGDMDTVSYTPVSYTHLTLPTNREV